VKALVWHATNDVRVERVPDPAILNPRDAIVKITATAICGSDLHMAAENSNIEPGDTIAVWGAARSARWRSEARCYSAPGG